MSKKHYQEPASEKEKKFYAKFLAEDEELVLVTGFSPVFLRQGLILSIGFPGFIYIILIVLAAWLLKMRWDIALLVGLGVAVVMATLRMIHTDHANRYLLTTRRVMIKKGVFAVKLSTALYDKITHIEVEQGFVDRLFLNHGKLIIHTAGSNHDEIALDNIEAPVEFKNLLERLINREREQWGRPGGPVVSLEGELVD